MGRTASGILLTLLLIGLSTLAFDVKPVKAGEVIYIRADGSIEPSAANITTTDNVTYTFTDDNYASIVVERSNIVVDGNGCTLQGPVEEEDSIGFYWNGVSNVTITNTTINGFWCGVHLANSSHNILCGNYIPWCQFRPCIYLDWSSHNLISRNTLRGSGYGYGISGLHSSDNNISGNDIEIGWRSVGLSLTGNNNLISGNRIYGNSYGGVWISGDNNTVTGNQIAANYEWAGIELEGNDNSLRGNTITSHRCGIYISDSSNNTVSENDVANNYEYGISLFSSSSNTIYHNNFIDNAQQVDSFNSTNVWDDGYPSGGNYWSDYNGTDGNSDGIGDTPYVIDVDNQDRYPLMHPWSHLPVHNINTGLGYATIQEAIDDANEGDTVFVRAGTYYEHLIIDKSITFVGEDRNTKLVGNGTSIGFSLPSEDILVKITGFTIENHSIGVRSWGSGHANGGPSTFEASDNLFTGNEIGACVDHYGHGFIAENTFLENVNGIYVGARTGANITGNTILFSEGYAIKLDLEPGGNAVNNNIQGNKYGISIRFGETGPSQYSINGNTLLENDYAVFVSSVENYLCLDLNFYHNNFINNTEQVFFDNLQCETSWDAGYPLGGNYWSDYTGLDEKRGPDQNKTGSDGIGDSPYIIDASNSDHYPLMRPLGDRWVVDDDGPADFHTIQEAINAANSGATIFVRNGTYYENVVINKAVSLTGEDNSATIIEGDWVGTGISVVANGVNIQGFTIRGIDYDGINYGIHLNGSSDCLISENQILPYLEGILLSNGSDKNSICGNTIYHQQEGEFGISLYDSDSNNISGNQGGMWNWIKLCRSSNNIISGQDIGGLFSLLLISSCSNIITENNISSPHTVWLLNSHNNAISRNEIIGLECINLLDSFNNTISKNKIEGTYPIRLLNSSSNTIYENEIEMEFAETGVYIANSSSNRFYHNNMLGESEEEVVHIETPSYINFWDNGCEGNYWSNYNGTDIYSGPGQDEPTNDGIGDTPYVINASNVDRYPLVLPYKAHNVAVIDVETGKTAVGQGVIKKLDANVSNAGSFPQSFSLTVYVNGTETQTLAVTLAPGNSTKVRFYWDTTGFAYGNYNITARAWPVPQETNTTDNVLTSGWVLVTIPGDVDGDHDVDIFDIVLMAGGYGKPPWGVYMNCDIEGDGDIDIFDLVIAASNYGKSW